MIKQTRRSLKTTHSTSGEEIQSPLMHIPSWQHENICDCTINVKEKTQAVVRDVEFSALVQILFKKWSHLPWISLLITSCKEAPLHSKWRLSQKTTLHPCRSQQLRGSPAPMDVSTSQLLHLRPKEPEEKWGRQIGRLTTPESLVCSNVP